MSQWDNIAYTEYYATKGKAAFNYSHTVKEHKNINQYCTRTIFMDNSSLVTSSCNNKINRNYMRCVTPGGEAQAERILFT